MDIELSTVTMSSSDSSSALLSLVSIFVQAIMYGIYIPTLIHCLRFLIYTNEEGLKRREKMKIVMLIISVALFLLQTTGLAIFFQLTLKTLGVVSYWDLYSIETVNSAMEYTMFQIVDAVLIYRCWVVYSYSWKITCLPILFWITSVVLSSYNLYLNNLLQNMADASTIRRLMFLSLHIWEGFYACNIVVNIYATTAIVYRIVSIMRISPNPSVSLSRTWHIIAESGALYTISAILNLAATVLVDGNVSYGLFAVVADPINFTMAGIAFNLVLIRVGQQRESHNDHFNSSAIQPPQQLSALRFRPPEVTETTLSSHNPTFSHSNTDGNV